ncbi:MAG: bacillithiol biosynthesis deacetylase BshB1 [Saprospiraceae bacterium]|nr:bacillithiol biosynthesis deacetylase BshB1 [Saprospiraceae bacterium]MDW8229890.1 bacillithiol biosynthesis deacetylase BshB1 [Saprospiraceae bacterium]
MNVDILAIGAHPDDVELSASGTLLHQADKGHTFGLLDLTRGELGSRGSAELRTQEAQAAAQLLGAAFRTQLDLPDGFFEYSPQSLLAVIRVIRQHRPRIVLCNAPSDRHPDHGKAARLAADACFYAGLLKIETYDDHGKAQQPWRPQSVFHYIQDRHLTPHFIVDITPYFERKMQAILAFRSQFYDPDAPDEGPQTPISSKDFLDFMEAKARIFGRSAQVRYAEGFIASRIPAVSDLFALF